MYIERMGNAFSEEGLHVRPQRDITQEGEIKLYTSRTHQPSRFNKTNVLPVSLAGPMVPLENQIKERIPCLQQYFPPLSYVCCCRYQPRKGGGEQENIRFGGLKKTKGEIRSPDSLTSTLSCLQCVR